jgi:hypothetical protein
MATNAILAMATHAILTLSLKADEKLFVKTANECFAKNASLSKGSLGIYPRQLKNLLKKLGVDTVSAALKLAPAEFTEALADIALSTRSAYINSLVALCKACDIPVPASFEAIKKLNQDLGHEKMDALKDNAGVIPESFDAKVAAYLAANPGSRKSVIVALLALSPALRGHMFEATVIARGKEEYDRIKAANESPVIGVLSETDYRFTYVAGNRDVAASAKVSTIRAETVYAPEVVKQLSKYIQPGQTYLFPPIKGKTAYVSTKTFNETWIPEAFAAADLPGLGIQKLRRISETRFRMDPTKTVAEKDAFSAQMNHSRAMGDNYVVTLKGNTPHEERVIKTFGDNLSKMIMFLKGSKNFADTEWANEYVGKMNDALQSPTAAKPQPAVYVNRGARAPRKPIGGAGNSAAASGSGGGGLGVVKGTGVLLPAPAAPPMPSKKLLQASRRKLKKTNDSSSLNF